ncbi:MAG: LysR family transcriptional regulator [Gammaproteobacteria bacterium]|nr:LysR family transcriptional regulator [Gammaproteobacteria bacterium]
MIHTRIRIDFTAGPSIGPGKIALLERIEACGSLSQAARELGLSYRRGWLLLDDLNRAFDAPVVVTSTGGAHGGGARLTDLGQALIECYRRAEAAAEAIAQREFRALSTHIARSASGRVRSVRSRGTSLRRPLQRSLKDV